MVFSIYREKLCCQTRPFFSIYPNHTSKPRSAPFFSASPRAPRAAWSSTARPAAPGLPVKSRGHWRREVEAQQRSGSSPGRRRELEAQAAVAEEASSWRGSRAESSSWRLPSERQISTDRQCRCEQDPFHNSVKEQPAE